VAVAVVWVIKITSVLRQAHYILWLLVQVAVLVQMVLLAISYPL
jgi:hypothetical protein